MSIRAIHFAFRFCCTALFRLNFYVSTFPDHDVSLVLPILDNSIRASSLLPTQPIFRSDLVPTVYEYWILELLNVFTLKLAQL